MTFRYIQICNAVACMIDQGTCLPLSHLSLSCVSSHLTYFCTTCLFPVCDPCRFSLLSLDILTEIQTSWSPLTHLSSSMRQALQHSILEQGTRLLTDLHLSCSQACSRLFTFLITVCLVSYRSLACMPSLYFLCDECNDCAILLQGLVGLSSSPTAAVECEGLKRQY